MGTTTTTTTSTTTTSKQEKPLITCNVGAKVSHVGCGDSAQYVDVDDFQATECFKAQGGICVAVETNEELKKGCTKKKATGGCSINGCPDFQETFKKFDGYKCMECYNA